MAIQGGPPIFPDGPPPWPINDEEVRCALDEAYQSRAWGQYEGPNCQELAERLAQLHDVPHVTLCCSGTFAVELALRGLGIEEGDEVILAGYDFGGNFGAIEAVGARPVLVDIDPSNWNFDPGILETAISPQTRAVIVSHLHGVVVPMQALTEVARRHDLSVVEDACQMPVARVEGRPAGTWGDVGVLSFGGSKLLSAGRGGALLTARADINQRARLFCRRGNHAFPLSELQAAVLLPQLGKLPQRSARRRDAAQRLIDRIDELPGLAPLENRAVDSQADYYKLGVKYAPDQLGGCSRDDFTAAVRAEGVALDAGFRGFARRSPRRCRHVGGLSQSRLASERMLVLHHPVLLEADSTIDRVADALAKVVGSIATVQTM